MLQAQYLAPERTITATELAVAAGYRSYGGGNLRYGKMSLLLQPRIEDYRQWIRDRLEIDDVFGTTSLLNDAQRETLALGRFLWEQIEQIKASNFAGPVLLFTGVLEEVTRITLYQHSSDDLGPE